MNRISSIETLALFAQTAVRRMINRGRSMKISLKRTPGPADAAPRAATVHRAEQTSLLKRLCRNWLPIMSLFGMLVLSFNTMFTTLESALLDESRAAKVLRLSPDDYAKLQQAATIADQQPRAAAVKDILTHAYASPAPWLSTAEQQLAQQRFDQQGLAAFAPLAPDSRWSGTLAYLSPEGRATALRIIGAYLALLNLAIFCMAFGLMSKNLSTADPSLVWLWQFPVSRRVLFFSKLVEYLFDNVTAPVTAIFYATVLMLSGASFGAGVGLGLLLGLAAAVTGAAARLALEIFMTQRLNRRMRGAIVAASTTVGSMVMLLAMIGGNSQTVVESFTKVAAALPAWFSWNPFAAGMGSDAMLAGSAGWWLVAPAIAAALAISAIMFAVWLTRSGLASAQDSARRGEHPAAGMLSRPSRFSAVVGKELLQMRRQPEMLGQVLATPLMIGALLYVAGYQKLIDLATNGGTSISAAILAGVAYMLAVAAGQTLGVELKTLWLLQCQPKPLADVVRGKARVWGAIAVGMSLPFVGAAIAMRPSEAAAILVRLPFLIAALWLLAELVFGLTALSASVTGERTVRFRRSTMLIPGLVVSNAALAIYSQSWWLQLSVLATFVILNAAVRERMIAELPWLSEPVETPPKQFSPMHGILAVIGFQTLMGAINAILMQASGLSQTASTTLAYCASAIIVGAACAIWLRRNRAVLPALDRGPTALPILWGLSLSCVAGLATTLLLLRHAADSLLPAEIATGAIRQGAYDKWWLLALFVVAAPVFEEWIFRGLLYRSLRRTWGSGWSIALTALLFATIHPVAGCVALLTLGTMTARAAEKTGRLWPSIAIHAGYNFMVWCLCIAGSV